MTSVGGVGGVAGLGISGGGIGFGCFEAGSRVATPGGSLPIEQLRVGDAVLAFDELSGSVEARLITATFIHQVPASGRLALTDGRELQVTGEHPIYDAELGAYVRADAFDGDETLVTLTQTLGDSSPVAEAASLAPTRLAVALTTARGRGFVEHARGSSTTVYNISVEGLENYFVEGVLVHNKSGGPSSCFDASPTFMRDSCAEQAGCIGAQAVPDHVDLNEPVDASAGGAPNLGAGGEGHVEPGEGGAGGGGAMVDRDEPVSVPTCADFPTDETIFIALDYQMPNETGGVTGFAIYQGAQCAGVHLGEVRLEDYAPPPRGSFTTQCVRLNVGAVPAALTVHSLHPQGQVQNMRVVSSCACPRALGRWTTCGVTPASLCE